jgi:hypothetical protein
MTCLGKQRPLKHLGSLHGRGRLFVQGDEEELGPVRYEIDGYLDRTVRSANGQIEGGRGILRQAFMVGTAMIVLADGQRIQVVLSDPDGSPVAEVAVSGRLPLELRR